MALVVAIIAGWQPGNVVAIIAGWQPGNVVVTAVIVVLVVVVVVVGVAVVATYSSSSNGRVVVGANRGSGRVAEVLPAPILAAAVFPALAAGRGRLLPPRRRWGDNFKLAA